MQRLWDNLIARLAPDPALDFEQTLFHGLCQWGGLVTLLVVEPVNLLQNLDPLVNWLTLAFGLCLLGLAWAARRGHYLRTTAFLAIVIGLDLAWFPNAGSQGSIGLYFFIAALFLVVCFRGPARPAALVFLVADIIALHLAERAWPGRVHVFTGNDRLLDLATGYALSMLICGSMLGVVLQAFDRERQRFQATNRAALDSERLYRELLERQGEGFGLVDGEEKFIYANPLAEQVFGVQPGQLVGRSLLDFLEPGEQERVRAETELRARNQHSTYELAIRRADGETRIILVTATPGRLSADDPLSTIGVFRDITEEKRAQETARQLDQEKLQAQKMDSLGSLAGGVAHDFNNMLAGILGYADLLMAGEQDAVRRGYLRSIVLASSRSAELTRKLLAFGRRGKNLVEALDLKARTEDCLAMLRPSMSPDLKVVVAMDGCPTVDGDPSQIHQVIVNLCLNAMEAMAERGTLTLAAAAASLPEGSGPAPGLAPGEYVELRVSDTGIGMTEEVRKRIFEPFYTTKNSTEIAGTGLGLSTVYGIVQAHRGTIQVESARGKGSTFRVFLPKGSLAPAAREPAEESAPGQGTVLLVEDELLLRELGASVLESLGYDVLTAMDGLEAIELFGAHHDRLGAVLLDLKMPRMGGREAFAHLRRIDPAVPVIVCTGFGENEEVQELLTQGAAGMLGKPYRIAELAARLRQATAADPK